MTVIRPGLLVPGSEWCSRLQARPHTWTALVLDCSWKRMEDFRMAVVCPHPPQLPEENDTEECGQEIEPVHSRKSLVGQRSSREGPWEGSHQPTVQGGRSKIVNENGLPITLSKSWQAVWTQTTRGFSRLFFFLLNL